MNRRKQSMYKGLPLVDASKDLEIEVTKSDVKSAKKNDPANCAAALATKRQLKAEVEVHISRTYIKDEKNKRWIRFNTSQSISREITSFDRSSIFEPGKYILKVCPPAARLGTYRGKSTKTESRKKRHQPHHIIANIRASARNSK